MAVGDGRSGGTVITTSSDLGTVSTDTVPSGVTDINQVTCPTANGCYALGTTATGPVLLAGAVGQTAPQTDTWAVIAPPSTNFTNLSSIACPTSSPTSSTCEVTGSAAVGTSPSAPEILRLDGDPTSLATDATWLPTFTTDSLPTFNSSPTVSSLEEIACPTSTECLAVATGDSTSPTDPTILTATIGANGASTWSDETFPTGAGSITGLSCTPSTCLAIGTMPAASPTSAPAPAVWTGDLTGSPHGWARVPTGPNGIPTSVLAVTSVACGQPATTDTADCSITAATSLAAPGQLLEGSLTGGTWVWNFSNAPSGSTVLYYTGVACEAPASASRSTCAAAGATASGPIIVSSSTGPSGTWTSQTPSALANTPTNSANTTGTSPLNATVTGIPLEITPAAISNWTTPVSAGAASNATELPNTLYPYSSGYSVAAGDCQAEANSTSIAPLLAATRRDGLGHRPLGAAPVASGQCKRGAGQRGHRRHHVNVLRRVRRPIHAPGHRRRWGDRSRRSLRQLQLHRDRWSNDHFADDHLYGQRQLGEHSRHHAHRPRGSLLRARARRGAIIMTATRLCHPHRGPRFYPSHPKGVRDDTGMTLTELLIASTLLVVLLTVVMTSMNLISSVTDNVSAQYEESDQAVPALAPLEALVRSEVEPGPTTAVGAPTPGFGVDTPAVAPATADTISGIGNFSLTFYANIGTAYHNVTGGSGTTAGPAMIVAEELDQSGNPVTSASSCLSATPCSFQVREYLPTVDSFGVSSCPFTTPPPAPPPMPDLTPPPPCSYSSKYAVITNVLHVVNNPSLQSGGGPTQPIFTYDILDTTNDLSFQLASSEVQSGTILLSEARGYPAPGTNTVNLTSCAPPNGSYPTCPADAIQSVGIDLTIGVAGSGSDGNVENQVIAYRFTPASVPLFLPTYPYLYSSSVG